MVEISWIEALKLLAWRLVLAKVPRGGELWMVLCTVATLFVLIVAVFGTLILALILGRPGAENGPTSNGEGDGAVVVNVSGQGGSTGQTTTPPQKAPQNLTLDLDVNAVAVPPEATRPQDPGSDGNGPPQAIDFTLNDNRSFSPSVTVPPAGEGSGGRDLVVVLDREKVVEKTTPDENGPKPCERLCTSCTDGDGSGVVPDPCATAKLIARVRFQPGKRQIISWHGAQNTDVKKIGEIAQDLEESAAAEQRRFPLPAAALLVVGHTDAGHTGNCLGSSRGKRRAKKVRRELRGRNERLSEIPIYAQAAGDDPMAPEGSCEARYFGTAGVYLIEGMR